MVGEMAAKRTVLVFGGAMLKCLLLLLVVVVDLVDMLLFAVVEMIVVVVWVVNWQDMMRVHIWKTRTHVLAQCMSWCLYDACSHTNHGLIKLVQC
jgi:hypothetical protein